MPQPKETIKMKEWQTEILPDVSLTREDRRFLRAIDNRLKAGVVIDELRRGLRISTSSSVGVVRLDSIEVRVVPKLAGDNLRLIEMIELTTGIDTLRRTPGLQTIDAKGANLFDLVALMLVEEAERIVRNGLLSDYVTEEDAIPAIRGRLLADRQILKRFGQLDRICCRFDEPRQDVVENRLIAAALGFCVRRVENEMVRRRANQVLTDFLACCEPRFLNLATARHEITYNRLNEHYRDAHELAWLVLDGIGVDDLLKPGGARCFCFLLDMNALFERFVYQVVKRLLPQSSFHLTYQATDRSIIVNDLTRRPYARVIPDILVRPKSRPSHRLAVDAKYKLYDTKRVGSSDIYQAFIYAYAYGGRPGNQPQTLLVYPASKPGGHFERLRVRTGSELTDARVSVLGFHIPSVLDEIKARTCGPASTPLRSAMEQAFELALGVDTTS